MRRFFGWSERSGMPSVYVHINMEDVDSQVMTDAGLEEAARPEPVWRPWTCARCATVNEAESPLCGECNLARDADVAEALAESREDRAALGERVAALERMLARAAPGVAEMAEAVGPAFLDAVIREGAGEEGEAPAKPGRRVATARPKPKPAKPEKDGGE